MGTSSLGRENAETLAAEGWEFDVPSRREDAAEKVRHISFGEGQTTKFRAGRDRHQGQWR